MRAAVVGLGLLGVGLAGPAGAGGLGFQVAVNLTPAAIDALKRFDEAITVSTWYYAEPKAGAEAQTNPVGLIDLGTEDHELGSFGGTAAITGAGVDPALFGLIGGPVQVNVNVFSARKTEADNVLDCDFFDGAQTVAAAAPVALRCGLITEHIRTRTLP